MQKEQIPKFKKQVDAAMIGYLNLLQRKELLSTSIDFHKSLASLEPILQRSILVIQDTIYTSLIIEIHAWLFDKSKKTSNLSINQLLNEIVDENFNSKNLLEHYAKPPKTILLFGQNGSWHDKFIEDRKLEFKQNFSDCIININKLFSSGLVDRVKLLRDTFLAHKDGEYNMAGDENKIQDVFILLSHMKVILVSLNKLLQRVSYPMSDSEKIARENAERFWLQLTRA